MTIALSDATATPSVVESTRSLGLTILASQPGETLVTSPASTVVALSMLGTGATGETDEQLGALMGATGKDRDAAVNALTASLDPYREDPANINPDELPEEPQLHLANRAVINEGTEIEQAYLDHLVTWFDAGVTRTNLGSEAGKKTLDEWINTNTAGLIEQSSVQPSPDLRLVLQNAILFAAPWTEPFDPSDTSSEMFTTADGSSETTDFIFDIRAVEYAQTDGWKMIRLPYGSEGELSASYVLPPEGTPLGEIGVEDVANLEKRLSQTDVRIQIPKLDLSSSLELIPALEEAGLHSVFDSDSPALEHISTAEDLTVTQITQQGAFVLDEEGTVAAVTTEIGMDATSADSGPPPEEFIADHPHLIMIHDDKVGWDLFQVAVNDPTA